jgi:hypothetical protein
MESQQLKQSQIQNIKAWMETIDKTCAMVKLHMGRGSEGQFMLQQYQNKRDELFNDFVKYVRRLRMNDQDKTFFIVAISVRFYPDVLHEANPNFQDNPILKAIA